MQLFFKNSIEPLITKSGRSALEAGKRMNYTLSGAKIGECVYTQNCNSCSSLLLNANEHNFLAHIDPKNFNMRTFIDNLKAKICNFQDKYGEAQGLIIGGWAGDRKDEFVSVASDLVYSTMAIVIDKMPLSMICGKKNGIKPLESVFAKKNKVIIGCDTFDKIGITNTKPTAQELEEKLSSAYEWVEIDAKMLP